MIRENPTVLRDRERQAIEEHVLDSFQDLMENRMTTRAPKYGRLAWRSTSLEELRAHLREEVQELEEVLDKAGNPARARADAADVANLAMMVADFYLLEGGNG